MQKARKSELADKEIRCEKHQQKTHNKAVNTVRIISAEAIQKANSGHPGICIGAAPIAYELFAEHLNFSYKNPKWDNRDRFVLSAGHGSMLLYTLLHLFGYDVTKEDLMNFRQFGSRTPGHPEVGKTDGVEVSTGPLGQGIGNAVGFAVAEAHLAAVFNKPDFPVVDHYTYALCGEGCLEEGIGYEACSFAGTQKLGKLILFYDDGKMRMEILALHTGKEIRVIFDSPRAVQIDGETVTGVTEYFAYAADRAPAAAEDFASANA